ncbi:MAG TPA: alpha/beta family hydrolase [Streptosporangiaceae bacterium]|jgi:hypothetical protein
MVFTERVEIETSYGPARADIDGAAGPGTGPAFLLALTHGAGGGVDAPDLLAVRDAGLLLGAVVARITQPYRTRGARAPGDVGRQDAAWAEIIAALRRAIAPAAGLAELPLVQGGRSNGARVACRTAEAVGAAAVIALAFPLCPPGRPEVSRAAELKITGRRVLVVNGERDPFGVPGRGAGRRVVVLPGETHALSRRPAAVGDAVTAWLPGVLGIARPAARRQRQTRTNVTKK